MFFTRTRLAKLPGKGKSITKEYVFDASTGINPTAIVTDPWPFVQSTIREVTFRTNKKPTNYYPLNPDSTGKFLGTDGNWYILGKYPKGIFNCYAYAMGWTYRVPHAGYYLPGFTIGKFPRSAEELIELVKADLEKMGRKIYKVYLEDEMPEKLPKAPEGTYYTKILFRDNDFFNFHFARKDELSGRWIHKGGYFAPPKVFMRNEEIYTLNDLAREYCQLVPRISIAMAREILTTPIFWEKTIQRLYVTKSKYEDKDNANYLSFDIAENLDNFIQYIAYAILLIDF